ncbi:ROK family protein [Actinosynnema pretiosum subsp. pretiosum]|uniref:ROK family protein n=2 Tax=Actinosynnema TaxID=40566 RepID=C6W8U2_ACTMD|nr:ROK family protein [Actinosynnema mirum]ACU37191.1 ROK family protein [Actinosynnema mirum DSM 43827]AXX30652.1 ROK domain-containing protein [Actinosynnema pretiosum subsp. pretiosum]QUF05220.1 ROK family protein [Actinosynnema pretiosum subsp. pretiosum]
MSGALLGVDVGGTKVALRLERGPLVLREGFRWPGDGDPRADLDLLGRAVADLAGRAGAPLDGVGIAFPGTVDGGVVTAWPSRPGWVGVDLAGFLGGLAAPVLVADDGDLAALAEARAHGCADLVYAGVGTGVGGGVVSGGLPFPGPERGSCELGHVVVALDGPPCPCGRAGCVQAFASGPAVLAEAARLGGAPVTGEDLVRALGDGRGWARAAVERGARALAAALVGVGELARPSLCVVGGGFAAAVPGYVDAVADRCAALARPGHPTAPVRPALLGGLSSLRGAVHAAGLARDGGQSTRSSSARAANR